MADAFENTRSRALTALAACLLPAAALFAASSFDGDEWFGKREVLAREAERLAAAYTNCAEKAGAPATDVSIPVETYDDGSVKTLIKALKAQFFQSSGLVWAQGVTVIQYDEKGSVAVRIDAERCVVDRNTKSGWADGYAKAVYGKTTVVGRNVYFSFEEQYISIFENAEIVSDEIKMKGIKL